MNKFENVGNVANGLREMADMLDRGELHATCGLLTLGDDEGPFMTAYIGGLEVAQLRQLALALSACQESIQRLRNAETISVH